jgi:HPt (histidine-containing phosphotransfer) domain-containing protein
MNLSLAPQLIAEEAAPVVSNVQHGLLLDRERVDEIRLIERASGRTDVLSGIVATLEKNIAGFSAAFSGYIARGDGLGAARAAHTLRGSCHQVGAQALGNLFAEIERSANTGNYAEARRSLDAGAALMARSLEALKQA